MTHKFKFFVNGEESEIYEYNEADYDSYDDLLFAMEQDRIEWTFAYIHSGYIKIEDNDNK